jgi:hypothetical protein
MINNHMDSMFVSLVFHVDYISRIN